MDDTCRGKSCWLYTLIRDLNGNGDPEIKDCPFYQEMIWTPDAVGDKVESAKVIKDCVNKRSLLATMEFVYPRLLGLQQANEQQRNKAESLNQSVGMIIDVLRDAINRKHTELIEQCEINERIPNVKNSGRSNRTHQGNYPSLRGQHNEGGENLPGD